MKAYVFAAVLAAVVVIAGCAGQDTPPAQRLSQLPAVPAPADNPITAEKIALGKQLFFDPRLSGTGKMSCEGCHYRNLGWTDAKALSTRDDGGVNARHTPTLYNVGHLKLWYWDGRAPTLEGQTLAAWRNQMSGNPDKVAAALAQIPVYAAQFQKLYGGPPTGDTIVKSLTTYLRTLNSGDSPWERYEKGDARAVSADAIAGQKLFMDQGRCFVCHTAPLYSDSSFHNIGLEAGKPKPDPGRMAVTKDPKDMSAFKTPTLRSVAISGPYFHDGSAKTLEEAVRLMANGGKPGDPNKSAILVDTKLSDRQIAQVVAFLQSLTSDEPLVRPTVP